jgi:dUTP pyrophosphatase
MLKQDLLNNYGQFMHLKIFVDSVDEELVNKYKESINLHNEKLTKNMEYIDAGFDLFAPQNHEFVFTKVDKIDYQIICSAKMIQPNNTYNTGYYMYPRSSISKSKLRLANNVGIIDAGYRGHLMGMFDCIYDDKVAVNKFDRHLQICAPGLIPIFVELVSALEELGEQTIRGSNGFGSTGK